MRLTTETNTELVQAAWTAPTAIEPRQTLAVQFTLSSEIAGPSGPPVVVRAIEWTLPEGVELVVAPIVPIELTPEPRPIELVFRARGETFGEMSARLQLDETTAVELAPAWISVFERRREAGAALSDEGRARLVAVVNARDRNGHIFLADFAAFFDDFLNIEVPRSVIDAVSEELLLGNEDLPLAADQRLAVVRGDLTFYGITRLELEGAEDCEDGDELFVADAAREVARDPDFEEDDNG